MNLKQCFETKDVVVTAHRGCAGRYPENTLLAFKRAIEIGADLIEFDLRGTKDNIPVVLHDKTIDRTSTALGLPGDYTLKELKELNFSCWVGPGYVDCRLEQPAYPDVTIPTFEEVLLLAGKKIGLNIQVYEAHEPLLSEICRLYDKYDLYEQGYLSMDTYTDARAVRNINPDIELCVLEDQKFMNLQSLKKQKDFGLKYIQPLWLDVSPELCWAAHDMGFFSSMFYSNTDEDNRKYIGYSQQGILTDYPDTLLKTISDLGLNKRFHK